MNSYKAHISISVTALAAISCLEPYQPPVSKESINYLVIEGTINSTENLAKVKITRALPLSTNGEFPTETGAIVVIERFDGSTIDVPETSPGVYSTQTSFDSSDRYRLRATVNGKKYSSDFITLEGSNPIDSISWTADNTGLEINVNTHDNSEAKKYYRYTYEETHEYRSAFYSYFKYENGLAIFRKPGEEIYQCWLTAPSNAILVTSTTNLSQNIISNFNLTKIERGDVRLWHRYSVLVKQYSISESAYNYWSQMKTLTESLGGLFDPIPFEINGNIHAEVNDTEPVLGYFSGGEVSEQRIVLDPNKFPDGYQFPERGSCEEFFLPLQELANWSRASEGVTLTHAEYLGPILLGYWYSSPRCVDCTLGRGTNVKPDFMN